MPHHDIISELTPPDPITSSAGERQAYRSRILQLFERGGVSGQTVLEAFGVDAVQRMNRESDRMGESVFIPPRRPVQVMMNDWYQRLGWGAAPSFQSGAVDAATLPPKPEPEPEAKPVNGNTIEDTLDIV